MDTLYRDVSIYASCDKDPVLRTSRLTLAGHSALLASYLGELSVCDGCEGSLAIIIADEDRDTVRAALGKVVSVSGVTVIKGKAIQASALKLNKHFVFCQILLKRNLCQRGSDSVKVQRKRFRQEHSNQRTWKLTGKRPQHRHPHTWRRQRNPGATLLFWLRWTCR